MVIFVILSCIMHRRHSTARGAGLSRKSSTAIGARSAQRRTWTSVTLAERYARLILKHKIRIIVYRIFRARNFWFIIAMIFCNSWTSSIVEKGKNEKWLSLHGEVWRITTGELKLIDANLNRSKHWCRIHPRYLCEPIVVTIFFLSLKRSTGFLSVSTKA